MEFIEQIDAYGKEINKFTSKQYLLVDVTNTYLSVNIVNAMKNAAANAKPKTIKMAVLGVTGLKKVLLNAVNSFSKMDNRAFDTKEQACEWLIS